jgi:chromosome partitioning protein
MARRIAFVNEKGGSCKTTLTVHMGAWLASTAGLRVLLIDLDPQGQLGKTLGYEVSAYKRTTLELLLDGARDPALFLRRTRFKGLDVVLSNKSIALLPTLVASDPDRDRRLLRAVERLRDYDFILFDSPASFGTIMLNLLLAAQEVIVPVNASFLALDGCAELVRTLEALPETHGLPTPEIRLIVPTLYRPTRMADSVIERLHAHFPGRVHAEPLRYDVRMEEAQSHGLTIWEYDPRARSAGMLSGLGEHVLAMGPPREARRGAAADPSGRPALPDAVDPRGRPREL